MVRGFGHTMGSHAAKQIIKGNIDHSWRFMGLSTRKQWYMCIVWVGSMIWSMRGMYKDYYGPKVDQDFWGMAFAISLFVVPVVMIVILRIIQGMEVKKARKYLAEQE